MNIQIELVSRLETLLFAGGVPQDLHRVAKTLQASDDALEEALQALEKRYHLPESGLAIIRLGKKIQLGTKGKNATVIEQLREGELQETLSRATLETLAIVAYRAPVTRADIDAIRGVNSNFTLRHLLIRGLIEREGNPEDARGYLYRPTFDFLKTLGLEKVGDLPNYEMLSHDERLNRIFNEVTPAVEDILNPESLPSHL